MNLFPFQPNAGTILIKDIDRHENSAILSQLDASHWYGVYVIAETRSMIVRKSKFIKGQPFQEGMFVQINGHKHFNLVFKLPLFS